MYASGISFRLGIRIYFGSNHHLLSVPRKSFSSLLFQELCKDACGILNLARAGACTIIMCIAPVGYVSVCFYLATVLREKVGTDDTAVLLAEAFKQVLHHLIAMSLGFVIITVSTAAVQTHQGNYARYCSAYHTHTPYASAETGSYAQGCITVHPIEVGKCCHYALATAKTLHEKVYGQAHSLFHFR